MEWFIAYVLLAVLLVTVPFALCFSGLMWLKDIKKLYNYIKK